MWLGDAFGIGWVLVAAGAVLAPALIHGALIRSPTFGSLDQITYALPLEKLAWLQVHHGQLPLWNPYSALGMPIAFTWNSAPFGIPALVSYLFPLRMAYDVQIVVPLVIAGSGMYVLGRVLRLGMLGCVMAAVAYELGGIFMGRWLDPGGDHGMGGVAVRCGNARPAGPAPTSGTSVSLPSFSHSLSMLGSSEILLMFIVALVVFLTVWLARSSRSVRPILDLSVAGVAGVALSAPLLLPGIQVASGSIRQVW